LQLFFAPFRTSRKNEAPAISRILFPFARAATICLCDQYPGFKRREQRLIPYLVLLREGFAKTERITPAPGGLLPRLFTLAGFASGGLFSAALSFPGRIVPGIPLFKGLPALRSPDFPPVPKNRRLPADASKDNIPAVLQISNAELKIGENKNREPSFRAAPGEREKAEWIIQP